MIVHGGLYPRFFEHHGEIGQVPASWHRGRGKRMERIRRFLRMRTVDPAGDMVGLGEERPGSVHWTPRYDGREGYCFFGHDPQLDPATPLIAERAMGLDTGACFGGVLTAATVEPGTQPRDARIVSVPGSRYAEPRERWSDERP